MFKFKSLSNDQIGYTVDRDSYYDSNDSGVSSQLRKFNTYGDGMIQHSGMYGVQPEEIRDFLESLAFHLIENPSDSDGLSWLFHSRVSSSAFDFLVKLKYDEEKPKMYSVKHEKCVSANGRIKASDVGDYEPLPNTLDGTYKGVFTTLRRCKEYYWMSQFHCLILHEAIREHFKESYWSDDEFMMIWVSKDSENFYGEINRIRNAIRVIQDVILIEEKKEWFERYKSNLERKFSA